MIADGKPNGMIARGIMITTNIIRMQKIAVIFGIYNFLKPLLMNKSDQLSTKKPPHIEAVLSFKKIFKKGHKCQS